MILIIGGLSQGKLAHARSLVGEGATLIDGATCPLAGGFTGEIFTNLPAFVRRCLKEEVDPLPPLLDYCARSPHAILICEEVGSGIVPMDGEDRRWREGVGRLSCALAEQAEQVVRLFCGIPTTLKGGE